MAADMVKLVVEFKSPLSDSQKKTIKSDLKLTKIKLLSKFDDEYFKRTYKIESSQKEETLKEKLNHMDSVLNVEGIHGVTLFNIFPQNDTQQIGNDPLFQYQWGHFNQRQVVLKEKDDLHNIHVIGKTGVDVGWKSIVAKIPNMMKKNVTVAVIDTGVDFTHPDLKDNILLNNLECRDGQINLDVDAVDRDMNDYKADCIGHNFTVAKDSVEARVPFDDQGHGTHVAGIISAISGNSKGITGFSNKIKILPIKVLSKHSLGESMTDRLTMAILYAVSRGVDVINMSLGWSKALDTKYLRQAVQIAVKRNIAIIAAAGNNSSNDTIFPCAYPNIICVGAITNNGELAKFSNHGGNVDVLAPGDSIMSLTSRAVMPDAFSVRGYDIKNGTSQASPYVAALAALIKGVHPNIKLNELTARIFESTKKPPVDLERDKHVLHGLIQMDKALEMEPSYSIKPTFKVMLDVMYSMDQKRFGFRLPVKNFWKPAQNIKVVIKSRTKHLSFKKTQYMIPALKTNQVQNIQVYGDILDINKDSEFDLTIDISVIEKTVTGEGDEQVATENEIKLGSYNHRVPLVRYIENDKALVKVPVQFTGSPLPLINIKDGKLVKFVKVVTNRYQTGEMNDYYLRRLIVPTQDRPEIETGIEFYFFSHAEGKMVQAPNLVWLKEAIEILNVEKFDVNYDGVDDYFIRTLNEDSDGVQYIQYSFYNTELAPLYGENSNWRFRPDVIIDKLKDAKWIAVDVTGLGKVAVPLMIQENKLPEANQLTGAWDLRDNSVRTRLYYLSPKLIDGNIELKTKVIDDNTFFAKLRSNLGIAKKDSLDYLGMLAQSKIDLNQGVARILISTGRGYSRKYFQMNLFGNSDYRLKNIDTGYIRLESRVINPIINLDGETPDYHFGNSLIGFHSTSAAEINIFNKDDNSNHSLASTDIYSHSAKGDHLIGFLSNYVKNGEYYSFFQSRNNLIMVKKNQQGDLIVKKKPVIRFSFAGNVFNELYLPIVTKDGDEFTPGLYVDGTQITANRIHTLTMKDDDLLSPIKYSTLVPRNCKVLNPTHFGASKSHAYTFICINNKKKIEFNFLKLN
jgi:hypothetical protein